MIPVSQPFLPPFGEYVAYLEKIWERKWLTNNGPLVNELELELKEYLGVPHLLYLANGTLALQIAIKALELKGEILTTPFSYVASTSSIVWENCTPVFVDIDPGTFNMNPEQIQQHITKNTVAILATHVFGNPCAVDEIQEIAERHHLKVIYDAAHCFGVTYKGRSIYTYGDISTASFHATKIFHTVEGGAVVTKDPDLLKKMVYLRNFGHEGPYRFEMVGINAKNSELHAAMGLLHLKYAVEIHATRKRQYEYYKSILTGLQVSYQKIDFDRTAYNYSYFPILFPDEELLLKAVYELDKNYIQTRRYFYPSLSQLPYVSNADTPVANDISRRILCLPLYHTLGQEEQNLIRRILLRVQND